MVSNYILQMVPGVKCVGNGNLLSMNLQLSCAGYLNLTREASSQVSFQVLACLVSVTFLTIVT